LWRLRHNTGEIHRQIRREIRHEKSRAFFRRACRGRDFRWQNDSDLTGCYRGQMPRHSGEVVSSHSRKNLQLSSHNFRRLRLRLDTQHGLSDGEPIINSLIEVCVVQIGMLAVSFPGLPFAFIEMVRQRTKPQMQTSQA
jgi:hypothetical protein